MAGRRLTALFAALFALTTSAYAQTVKPGVLTVGTVSTYAPMAYRDPSTGQLTGFDVDLAGVIAEEMKLKLELVEVSFAQLMPSLTTGRIDTALAGMSDRPERREQANFINYLRSGAQFFSISDKASAIGDVANMCGKKVASSRGAQWIDRINEWSRVNCVGKGMLAIANIGSENTADTRTQLLAGRADAGVQGSETIGYLQKLDPGRFSKIGGIFSEFLVGMPFLKGNAKADALMNEVIGALNRVQQSGKYDEILNKYGIEENRYLPITINRGT